MLVLHRGTPIKYLESRMNGSQCWPDDFFHGKSEFRFHSVECTLLCCVCCASKQIVRAHFSTTFSHRHLWIPFRKPVRLFFLSIVLFFQYKTGKYFHITSLRSNCLKVGVDSLLLPFHIGFLVCVCIYFLTLQMHCTRRLALYYKIKIILYKKITAKSPMLNEITATEWLEKRNETNSKNFNRSISNTYASHTITKRALSLSLSLSLAALSQ